MFRFWGSIVTLLIAAVLTLNVLTHADAQQWTSPDPGFRVDWEQATTKRGTVIRGYVRNDTGYAIVSVRLLIESLDASGAVAMTTIGYLPGSAPAFNRLYFEVPVKAPAPTYRVRVASWDAIGRGGP